MFLLLPCIQPARADTDEAEARLAGATGQPRLDLLVELTRAYREENPARATVLGTKALELLDAEAALHGLEPRGPKRPRFKYQLVGYKGSSVTVASPRQSVPACRIITP